MEQDIGVVNRWSSLPREKYSRTSRLGPINCIHKYICKMTTRSPAKLNVLNVFLCRTKSYYRSAPKSNLNGD